jgi:hypothetical protein
MDFAVKPRGNNTASTEALCLTADDLKSRCLNYIACAIFLPDTTILVVVRCALVVFRSHLP